MFNRIQPTLLASARSLSTAAKSHAPPKKIFGVNGRYAMAAFTAASKAGVLDRVENELAAFTELLAKNSNVATYFSNPTVARWDKAARVGELFDEKTFSHISRNLLLTLAANGRMKDTSRIVTAYGELMQASRGAVQVTIITSEALKKKQLEAIQQAVGIFVGGKQMDVAVKVDENLLGGLQVQVDDRFLDLSVSSRINTLTTTLDSHA